MHNEDFYIYSTPNNFMDAEKEGSCITHGRDDK
jgi:hypothetical protein